QPPLEKAMRMPKRSIAALALAACAVAASAQQPGFTRKMLQDQNLSVQGRHAVQAVAEFAPGASAGKHTHPGEELGYILEGTLQLQVTGEPPRTLKAGEAFFIPAGVAHDGKNIGSGPAKVLATYVVEKGKPVATPAK